MTYQLNHFVTCSLKRRINYCLPTAINFTLALQKGVRSVRHDNAMCYVSLRVSCTHTGWLVWMWMMILLGLRKRPSKTNRCHFPLISHKWHAMSNIVATSCCNYGFPAFTRFFNSYSSHFNFGKIIDFQMIPKSYY